MEKKNSTTFKLHAVCSRHVQSHTHLLANVVGVLAVDCASDRHCSAEHLLHGASHVPGAATWAHDLGNCEDVIKGDVASVLDVLLL